MRKFVCKIYSMSMLQVLDLQNINTALGSYECNALVFLAFSDDYVEHP